MNIEFNINAPFVNIGSGQSLIIEELKEWLEETNMNVFLYMNGKYQFNDKLSRVTKGSYEWYSYEADKELLIFDSYDDLILFKMRWL